MKVAIHQPEHLPWLGFFHKMILADKYIVLDNVQYKKNYFENRNRINLSNATQWITVDVLTKGYSFQKISKVIINQKSNWTRKYMARIENAYKKTKYFDDLYPSIATIIKKNHLKLIDLNIELLDFVRNYFGLQNELLFSSSILSNKDVKGSELVLQLCRDVNADTYISGVSGVDYLNINSFEKFGINIVFQEFIHPTYNQLNTSAFLPFLSIIDLMFNYGPLGIDFIKKK